jgi:hypothetical protein
MSVSRNSSSVLRCLARGLLPGLSEGGESLDTFFSILFCSVLGILTLRSCRYSQIIFALLFDWAIWDVLPGGLSLFGGSIIIASTLWSALQKTQPSEEKAPTSTVDEGAALLGTRTEGLEEVGGRRASIGAASA